MNLTLITKFANYKVCLNGSPDTFSQNKAYNSDHRTIDY